MSGLADLLHKIVDVAAGVNSRQDLHDEIDRLDAAAPPEHETPAVEAAPEPPSEAAPAEAAAAPEPEPVQVLEPAPPVQVQEPVQEEGHDGEAFA